MRMDLRGWIVPLLGVMACSGGGEPANEATPTQNESGAAGWPAAMGGRGGSGEPATVTADAARGAADGGAGRSVAASGSDQAGAGGVAAQGGAGAAGGGAGVGGAAGGGGRGGRGSEPDLQPEPELDAGVEDEDAGITPSPTGSFVALTYNVAGLPEGLSSSMPSVNMPIIGPLLNGYDVVLLQESWQTPDPNPLAPLRGYHEILVASADHPYKTTPAPQPFGSNPARPLGLLSDGLNVFSRYPLGETTRVAWSTCVDTEADCLAFKGFSMTPLTLADGLIVHIYDLHMEAGESTQDVAARELGIGQLVEHIRVYSAGAAVIVGGDFNLHSNTTPDDTQFADLLSEGKLRDTCDELQCGDDGRIDKILYRSGPVTLRPRSWKLQDKVFVTSTGTALSDHLPVAVTFDWAGLVPID
ncbi:MAG: endonuclease/exonuclease/phosphatase family protein [Polyangiales bacterium]